jgi:hypothetical protein
MVTVDYAKRIIVTTRIKLETLRKLRDAGWLVIIKGGTYDAKFN